MSLLSRTSHNVRRRCINCMFMSLRHKQLHSLDKLSDGMLKVLNSWIGPIEVTNESILCHECFIAIKAHENSEDIPPPEFGHNNVCFSCGTSMMKSKSYLVPPTCEERNVILKYIPPHLDSRLDRVCSACWLSARRYVAIEQSINEDPSDLEEINPVKIEPNFDTEKFTSGDVYPTNIGTEFRIPASLELLPLDVESIKVENGEDTPLPSPLYVNEEFITSKIISEKYRRLPSTSRSCFVLGCKNHERLTVPKAVRRKVMIHRNLYMSNKVRVCQYHLENESWKEVTSNLCDFTGLQFDEILGLLTNST